MTPTSPPNGDGAERPPAIDTTRVAGQGELGALFSQARHARGLELKDVAELTHVRRDYLKALEEGRFADLPEDVYTRNFVRLFAQAVGVPQDQALEVYHRERQRAGGLTTLEEKLEKERRAEPQQRPQRRAAGGGGFRVNPAVPTFLLVVALVALAVWGYNALFFRSGPPPTQAEQPGSSPTAAPEPGSGGLAAPLPTSPIGAEPTPSTGTVLLDVLTDPPGAHVSVDGFMLPGVTPIRSAPVTARTDRTLRVTLEGYQPLEQSLDLTTDRTVELTLSQDGTAVASEPPAEPVGTSEILISVKATSWLEVYRGTARNEGERLVYTTAAPGQTYRFSLPVYVHAGNAAGVEITLDDAPPTAMGSAGAVVGRAFPAR